MMNKLGFFRIFSMSLAVFLIFSGCSLVETTRSGELQEETIYLDQGAATQVKVIIELDLGELNIHSTSGKLLDGAFEFNVPEWQPSLSYKVAGDKGTLRLTQPDKGSNLVSDGKNTWDLRLGEGIPMELEINLGAGASVLDLSRIDLTNLRISTGTGDLDLDLRGTWTHDIDIIIRGGLGETTLHLPEDIGIRVDVHTGLGTVNASGLEQNGSTYTNAAFGESSNRLNIQIDSGAGDVNLEG